MFVHINLYDTVAETQVKDGSKQIKVKEPSVMISIRMRGTAS